MTLSCYRKKLYKSEKDAQSAVYRLRAQGSDVETYKCDLCTGWHLRVRRAVPAQDARRLSA